MRHLFSIIGVLLFDLIFWFITCSVIGNYFRYPYSRQITDMYTIIHIISFFLGLIPAYIAHKKGRGFYKWWIYGYVLWLIAMIHSLCIKSTEGLIQCPACAEFIKQEAQICRYCHTKIGAVK